VSIPTTFYARIFRVLHCFSLVAVWLCSFLVQELAKAAGKMLMKLNKGQISKDIRKVGLTGNQIVNR